ncbi:hypothetical protein [Nocardia mexicana]|uniref:Uncharacterized protein n=1 Tax=Nocardia mexicana TaxID=279262 RepID=A0A370HHA1_9NOCA|nr:hypothetical protein [Nocardia mexicana]RDI54554.1 hypothetical protein DFR68_102682 [Nocardia mexicana]
MSEDGVTVADTVRWLHTEGLIRLAGVAGRGSDPIVAYTIDVATGTVSAHPAAGAGSGSDVTTLAADDLPFPTGTPGRLVIVGVTPAEAVLVVDLANTLTISINADRPELAARSWVTQLLLNPETTLTTNSAEMAIDAGDRLRQSFIPGGTGAIINVDDQTPPVTTVTLNADTDGPDHLDIAADGTGELYLGARFWQLRQVMTIDDAAWHALAERLAAPDEQDISSQPPSGAVATY